MYVKKELDDVLLIYSLLCTKSEILLILGRREYLIYSRVSRTLCMVSGFKLVRS